MFLAYYFEKGRLQNNMYTPANFEKKMCIGNYCVHFLVYLFRNKQAHLCLTQPHFGNCSL